MARNKYLDLSGLTYYDSKIKGFITDKTEALEAQITALTETKADKATTLSGYGIEDAYTKSEVDDLVAQRVRIEVLPSGITHYDPESARTDTIYLAKSEESGETDVYDEYVVVGETGSKKWEKIGSTKTDLKSKVDKVTDAVADNIVTFVAGGNIKDSGKKFTTTVAAVGTASDNNIATEKAVRDAISATTANLTDAIATAKSEAIGASSAYTDEQVASAVTILQSNITAEETARVEADNLLRSSIDSGLTDAIASAKTYTDAVHTAITNEIATAKDEAIAAATANTKSQIEALDAVVSSVTSEGDLVKVTIAEIDGKLTGVTVDVTKLSEALETSQSAVTLEAAARMAADAELEGKIDSAVTSLTASIETAKGEAIASAQTYTDNAISALDATVSTVSDANVGITIVETDGKLTSVTASIDSVENSDIDALFA